MDKELFIAVLGCYVLLGFIATIVCLYFDLFRLEKSYAYPMEVILLFMVMSIIWPVALVDFIVIGNKK